MTLKNLLKIGQLKEHPVSAEEIERLLTAAQRNLRDAHIEENSAETRFDVPTRPSCRAQSPPYSMPYVDKET